MYGWLKISLVWVACGLAMVSALVDIWVIISISQFKKKAKRKGPKNAPTQLTHDYIISDLLRWFAVITLLFSVIIIIDNGIQWKSRDIVCVVVAAFGQFTMSFVILWHLLIALYLVYLLYITAKAKYKKSTKFYFNYAQYHAFKHMILCVTFALSVFGAVIPLIFYKGQSYDLSWLYQSKKTGKTYDGSCWLSSSYEYFWIAISFISILLEFIVLIGIIYKYFKTRWFTDAYWQLFKRLSVWLFVLIITRIFTFIYIVAVWADPNYHFHTPGHNVRYYNIALWIVFCRHFSYGCYGMANGIAWYFLNHDKNHNYAAIIYEKLRNSNSIHNKHKNKNNNKNKIKNKKQGEPEHNINYDYKILPENDEHMRAKNVDVKFKDNNNNNHNNNNNNNNNHYIDINTPKGETNKDKLKIIVDRDYDGDGNNLNTTPHPVTFGPRGRKDTADKDSTRSGFGPNWLSYETTVTETTITTSDGDNDNENYNNNNNNNNNNYNEVTTTGTVGRMDMEKFKALQTNNGRPIQVKDGGGETGHVAGGGVHNIGKNSRSNSRLKVKKKSTNTLSSKKPVPVRTTQSLKNIANNDSNVAELTGLSADHPSIN